MNKIIAAFAAALCMTLAVTAYSESVQENLQSNMIRLHIIANSDSDTDQAVKLKVRDEILKAAREYISGNGEEDSRESIINNLAELEDTANKVLSENGFSYTAQGEYGKFYFPKKTYKSMTLPEGEYYGVRIVLGNGEGHNWWCVMYPPLCITDNGEAELSGESERILRENLDSGAYDIITGKDGKTVVKFKIVELVQKIKNKLK